MATEADIQYLWKHRLYCGKSLKTTCGLALEVLYPGEQNLHAGPDFTNARIRLGSLTWAGNVEVHVAASQWNSHGHHQDPAYDNVILHVVLHFDMEIQNSKGYPVPSLIIDPLFLPGSHVDGMRLSEYRLACREYIRDISPQFFKTWYPQLYMERLKRKVLQMTRLIRRFPLDREKALFVGLASGFGLPINSLPFEMLASGIPLSLLGEVKDCLPDLEALLFGQSGLLQISGDKEDYTASLSERYARLKKAGMMQPVPFHLWKFLRIRPASFPTVRLSQLASLIHLHFPFYRKFMHPDAFLEMTQWLELSSSPFWNTHYTFKNPSPHAKKSLGRQARLNLSLNVLIPFYGAIRQTDPKVPGHMDCERFLRQLAAEKNHITKKWISFGIVPDNALESQALIQLNNAYCKQKRCLDCKIAGLKPEYCR